MPSVTADLGNVASYREWGLIIALVAIFGVLAYFLIKSQSKREGRLIDALMKFSETLPGLTAALNELREWLGDRFADVKEDLSEVQDKVESVGESIEDHEKRIAGVERQVFHGGRVGRRKIGDESPRTPTA